MRTVREVTVGDTTPDLVLQLFNAQGPQDLTGATVSIVLKSGRVLPATVDPGILGWIRHEFNPALPLDAGDFPMQVPVLFANGDKRTWPSTKNENFFAVLSVHEAYDSTP